MYYKWICLARPACVADSLMSETDVGKCLELVVAVLCGVLTIVHEAVLELEHADMRDIHNVIWSLVLIPLIPPHLFNAPMIYCIKTILYLRINVKNNGNRND